MTAFSCAAMVMLAAGPGARLAAPPWQSVDVEQNRATFFADYLAQQIAQAGIRVTTSTEMQQLVGLERQKQLLGCSDASSNCLAELAGALGVDGVIIGSVARTGKYFVVSVKIIQASDGSQLALASTRLRSEDELVDWLTDEGPKLAESVRQNLKPAAQAVEKPVSKPVSNPPPEVVPAVTEPTTTHRAFPAWIPLASGAALITDGAVFEVLAQNSAAELRAMAPNTPPEVYRPKLQAGQTQETIAWTLLGVGAAAAATGVVLYALPHRDGDQTALNLAFSGNGVALSGSFR